MELNDEGEMASQENWILKMRAYARVVLGSNDQQEKCPGNSGR